jgi:hypothetical protein
VAAAKAVAACADGKEKSVGQIKPDEKGRERINIFFKTKSAKKKVRRKDAEKIITNFLSCLVIPGFFLSSKIKTINITNNQIKIKLPFKEKKEKKLLKNKL